jgi:hypothetical protein
LIAGSAALAGTSFYCPGGELTPSDDTIVGTEYCDEGLYSNANKTDCIEKKVISKAQMLYGINGTDSDITNQCWTITDATEYTKCVTGTLINATSGEDISQKINPKKINKKDVTIAPVKVDAEKAIVAQEIEINKTDILSGQKTETASLKDKTDSGLKKLGDDKDSDTTKFTPLVGLQSEKTGAGALSEKTGTGITLSKIGSGTTTGKATTGSTSGKSTTGSTSSKSTSDTILDNASSGSKGLISQNSFGSTSGTSSKLGGGSSFGSIRSAVSAKPGVAQKSVTTRTRKPVVKPRQTLQ